MCDNDDKSQGRASAGEWASLLRGVLSSFLLVRDLVGYLLPGGLTVLLVAHVLGPQVLRPLHGGITPWISVPVLIGLSYLAGQIVVALSYELSKWNPVSFWKWRRDVVARPEAQPAAASVGYYRSCYPALFEEADHQSVVAMLRTGLGGGLIVGAAAYAFQLMLLVHHNAPVSPWRMLVDALALLVAGLFMLHSGEMGGNRADRTQNAAIDTAQRCQGEAKP